MRRSFLRVPFLLLKKIPGLLRSLIHHLGELAAGNLAYGANFGGRITLVNVAADGADPLLSAGRDRGLFRLGRLAAHQDKVLLAVVAEGADEVVGDGLPLIDVAADRADPLLFLRTLGLGLDAA